MLVFGIRYALSDRGGQTPAPLQIGPWKDVLQTSHQTDAHAWPYVVYGSNGPIHPQIRLSVESPEKERAACHTIFLDYDNSNDHAGVLEALQEIPPDHYLYRAAAIYATKDGMRIVYRMEQPVTVTEYGPFVRGMALDLYRLTKLQVDPTTDQWHRCFRLPKVTRSDKKSRGPTWLEPYFFEPLISDATVTVEELSVWHERLPWDARARTLEQSSGNRPEFSSIPAHRSSAYKKVLKTSRFRGFLFDGESIPPGRRDQTLLAMSSEVVAKCFRGVVDSSPEEIFLLCLPVTEFMDRDGTESWQDKLWRMVQHVWNLETQKETERKQKQETDLTTRDVLVSRMLESIPKEIVPTDPVERREFIYRHYCLQTASGAFVLTPRGEYSKVPLRACQLPAHFNDNLHCLVDGGFRTSKGAILGGAQILNAYSTNLDDVEYVTGDAPGARLIVDNDKKILEIVPFALRQDLLEAAELDKECGEWLDSFQDSKLLIRWLAAALALHRGPVASCYLAGPARVGKSMLAMALAECFHCPPIPASHAFSEFNGALLTSPVIMVDEGLPTRLTGLDTADLFRSLVTGAPVSTQKKYQDQINSKIPYRIIFTANSFDMVKKLIGRRTMETQDRDAFRERILVIETSKAPADLLDRKGARQYTKTWIGGQCRLARHLLKLYKLHFQETEFVPDGRLLVEGRPHPAFTLSFDLSGAGRDVVDDLATDITKVATNKANSALLLRSVEVASGVIWLRKRPYVKLKCDRAPARAEAYSVALDRFLTGKIRTSATDMTQQAELDLPKLLFCANAEGLETTILQSLHLQLSGVR